MRLRLQMSVALGSTALTIIVLGVAIAVFLNGSRSLAIETAQRDMSRAHAEAEVALSAIFVPVGSLLQTAARFVESFDFAQDDLRGFLLLQTQMGNAAQVSSVFVAYPDSGEFRQVARLEPDSVSSGEKAVPMPSGATLVFRSIHRPEGAPLETLRFADAKGCVIGAVSHEATLDPRSRSSFTAATATDGIAMTPIYTFSRNGKAGITMALQAGTTDGAAGAVVGADVSLDDLSDMLTIIRVNSVGEAFLIDAAGQRRDRFRAVGGELCHDCPLNADRRQRG